MQSRIGSIAAGVIAGLAVCFTSHAGTSKATDATVGFIATGPAGLEIHGTTDSLDVSDDADTIVLTVPLGQVTTGIALRDRHMKQKYLEVDKYPVATLTIARSQLDLGHVNGKVAAGVSAKLSLHGIEKPVTVRYELTRDEKLVAVRGSFHVDLNTYQIAVPSYLGVTVKPDVDIQASFRVLMDSQGH